MTETPPPSNVETDRATALTRRQRRGPTQPPPPRPPSEPTVALALGSGGARGLAHIVLIEALDELGLRPVAVAGTSMGAVVGAAYCAGVPARALRKHAVETMRDRARVMTRIIEARVGRLLDMFNGLGNPLLLDGERLLATFLPQGLPRAIDELEIPFQAVATDFFGRTEMVYQAGPLWPAVAGSMAIPGLFKPVQYDERMLIDGGAVNPLPFDLVIGKADIVVAIDVAAGPEPDRERLPGGLDVTLGAIQIMQEAIVHAKLKLSCPQILLRPPVTGFRVLDFFEIKAIFDAVEPMKETFKRDLEKALEATARGEVANPGHPGRSATEIPGGPGETAPLDPGSRPG